MKVECPVCHAQGILETRGNSQRVLHYRGMSNGKRLYEKHSITRAANGNKTLGIKECENVVLLGNRAPPKGFATYNGKKLLVLFLNLCFYHSSITYGSTIGHLVSSPIGLSQLQK